MSTMRWKNALSKVAQQQGLSLLEGLIALALFSLLLTAVLASFATSQSSFTTQEAYIQAQSAAQSALGVVTQDLAGARIRDVGNNYVRFRRLQQGSFAFIDPSSPNLIWSNNTDMFVWCPQEAMTMDPCLMLISVIPAGVVSTTPKVGPLLWVDNTTNGNFDQPWNFRRVIALNVTSEIIGGATGEGFNVQWDGVRRVTLNLSTRGLGTGGRKVMSKVQAQVQLRNPQI